MAVVAGVKADALEAALVAEQERFGDVGFAVAVVKNDAVILEQGFGLRDRDAGLPVTERTLFGIGSSTKAFTATVLAALVGDGTLEWDRPVRDYLPNFRLHDTHASEQITALDLLCHNSGLPTHDFAWYGNHTSTRREIVEQRLRHLEPNRQFRQAWQYNNLMYLTAGHLAGELLGGTWEEAVRRRLLEPLGMTRTGFSVEEMAASDDWSKGYRDDDGRRVEMPLTDYGLAGPAGSINSCVRDMIAWLRVNLNAGKLGDKQVIAADALQTVHTAHMHMPAMDERFPERYFTGYGLGWFLESYRGERIVHHPGRINGFSALVLMAPRLEAGAVVLTNGNGTYLCDAVAYRILDDLLGLEPLPWGERYNELIQSMRAGTRESLQHRAAQRKVVAHSHPLGAYAGTYHHPGYGAVVFEVIDGTLHGRLNSLSWVADHRSFESFEVRLIEGHPGCAATFRTDEEGEVNAVVIPLEPSVAAIEFKRVPEELSAAQLEAFTGKYGTASLKLFVAVEKDGLTAKFEPDMGTGTTLVHYRGTSFKFKNQTWPTLEFVLAGGKVEKVVADPLGVLSPVAEDAQA